MCKSRRLGMNREFLRLALSAALAMAMGLVLSMGMVKREALADPATATHTHDKTTFAPWTSTAEQPMPTEAGTWYLTDDVTLSETWVVPTGYTQLCLNGKTITMSKDGVAHVITVPQGATLSLYDEDNTGCITHDQQLSNALGSGVYIDGGGKFYMYGGTISGNNAGEDSGGGVYDAGQFNMFEGIICGNTSCSGGGVWVFPGSFVMTGGIIRGNRALFDHTGITGGIGGGVCVAAGGITMAGGTITENTADNAGGGVYAGYPSIGVRLYGNPVIVDNTVGSTTSNLDIGGSLQNSPVARVTNALKDGARIGVTTKRLDAFTLGYRSNGNSAQPSDYFFSDDSSFSVLWTKNDSGGNGDEARLVKRRQISIANTIQGGTVTVDKTEACEGDTVTVKVSPNAGYELESNAIVVRSTTDSQDIIATNDVINGETVFDVPNMDVVVEATFTKIDYTVAVSPDISHGTVSITARKAHAGDSITVTANANAGYQLDAITIKDEMGNAVEITGGTFTMPTSNVVVSALFTKTPAPEPGPSPTPVPTPEPAIILAKAATPRTKVRPNTGEAIVRWNAVRGAKAYQIQWRKVGGKWLTRDVRTPKAKIEGLKKGGHYQIRVRGVASTSKGAWSKVARRWVKRAKGIRFAKGKNPGTIVACWSKDAKATAGFKVYVYAKKGGKAIKTVKASKGSSSVTIRGLNSGKRYFLRIRPYRVKRGAVYAGTISGYKAAKAR